MSFQTREWGLSTFSPSGVMIGIKNGCCWPLTVAWWGGKAEEDSKVIWDATAGILKELQMAFTPNPPQTRGRWCVFFLFCASACAFLLFRPFLLPLTVSSSSSSSFVPPPACAFNTLQRPPFVFCTHDLTENLQRPIIVGRRGLTVPFPAKMRQTQWRKTSYFTMGSLGIYNWII